MPDIIANLSRSWLIELVPRHNENMVSIRELRLKAKEARDKEGREQDERLDAYLLERGIELTSRDCHPMRAFRRVWPCKQDSKDWRLEWSSLPLQS